jgi:surfeit locus 1 family protein
VALPDDATLVHDGPSGLEYRRVTVTGRFLHASEIFLAETHRGKVGFDIVTPLVRDDGGVVFVNRGWIPAETRNAAVRADISPDGPVSIEGLVRATGVRNWLTPDNDLEKNYWFWLDPAAMATFAGVDAPPLVVVMGPTADADALPAGHRYEINIANDHLQYAITWFILAVAFAVIYVMSQMVRPACSAPWCVAPFRAWPARIGRAAMACGCRHRAISKRSALKS